MDRLERIEAIVEENAKSIKELQVSQAKIVEENAKSIKELQISQAKTDQQMNKVLVGLKSTENYIKNGAEILEDYFHRALEASNLIIGQIKYEEIAKDLNGKTRQLVGQYDIALFNSEHVFLVEVKRKPHVNDFVQLLKQRETFPQIFQDYKGFQIHLGLAGESFYADLLPVAKENGIYLLQPKADGLKIMPPDSAQDSF